jgi:hypothetical protein
MNNEKQFDWANDLPPENPRKANKSMAKKKGKSASAPSEGRKMTESLPVDAKKSKKEGKQALISDTQKSRATASGVTLFKSHPPDSAIAYAIRRLRGLFFEVGRIPCSVFFVLTPILTI